MGSKTVKILITEYMYGPLGGDITLLSFKNSKFFFNILIFAESLSRKSWQGVLSKSLGRASNLSRESW